VLFRSVCVSTTAKFAVLVLNKEEIPQVENPQVENPQIEAVESKCAHPNCTVPIRNGKRTYCSNHHNKSEHFKCRIDFYTSCRDSFGVYLCTILLRESFTVKKKNGLQPEELPENKPAVEEFETLSDLVAFFRPYIPDLLAVLGVKLDGTPNLKLIDQKNRVEKLLELFRLSGYNKLRLMDGHCGLLLTFLDKFEQEFGKERLNALTIELVDICPKVTNWHEAMFKCPRNIHCLTEDIIPEKPLENTTMLYMNFCAIAESIEKVIEFLKHSSPSTCMLSFTVMRAAKKHAPRLRKCGEGIWTMEEVKAERERKNFITFIVTRCAHVA